jgi:hypothetical protein
MDRPTTLSEIIEETVKIDNRFLERSLEKKGSYNFGRNSSRSSMDCQPTGTKGWPEPRKNSRSDTISQEYMEWSRKSSANATRAYGIRLYVMPCIG